MYMAIPNTLILSDAGTASVNGTYTKGADQNGKSAWYKDGFQIFAAAPYAGGSLQNWIISGVPAVLGGPGLNIYYSTLGIPVEEVGDSPAGRTFNLGVGSNPVPTIAEGSGGGSEPTFGLPADVVALITAAHGSVANFLRLRNQGQV